MSEHAFHPKAYEKKDHIIVILKESIDAEWPLIFKGKLQLRLTIDYWMPNGRTSISTFLGDGCFCVDGLWVDTGYIFESAQEAAQNLPEYLRRKLSTGERAAEIVEALIKKATAHLELLPTVKPIWTDGTFDPGNQPTCEVRIGN